MNVNVDLMEQYVIHINGRVTINIDVSVKYIIHIKNYVWNPATCNCENEKYLARIMDDSVITCDEVTESYNGKIKTIPTRIWWKNITCKAQIFYILLAFLFITIALLIAVSIYCYLTKY